MQLHVISTTHLASNMMNNAAILLLIFIHILSVLVSCHDTLKPGETLNSSSYLVSAKKTFTLGFYTNPSNNSYLGIWYTNRYNPVWIANRNRPVHNDPDMSMINSNGRVVIMHSGGDTINLFTAENVSMTNVTATLLDSGNFVVREMDSSGSSSSEGGEVLWQSFDYPTDTLLPGMKLGVSYRTGINRSLTSWLSLDNPASGAFGLEWDPIKHRLLIKRRGVDYWTSGDLKFYGDYGDLEVYAFDNIVPKPDPTNLNYLFLNLSSQDEDYFTYSLWIDYSTPAPRRKFSGWTLSYDGQMHDTTENGYLSIAQADLCYGYNTKASDFYLGCELWQQPKCRINHQKFSFRAVNYENVDEEKVDQNFNLSLSDCRANCWNDCLCKAYRDITTSEGGCLYVRGEHVKFHLDHDVILPLYILDSDAFEKTEGVIQQRKNGKWMIILAVTVLGLLFIVGIPSFFLVQKSKEGRRKMKKRNELRELMVLEGYTGTTEFENDGNNNIKLFSYSTILTSTDSFSPENKLGEGGFGPVYKGILAEGREIAVKLLSQSSGQGLLEFKTELMLVAKLQHRNLVKLLGFCIHGDHDKMIVYDYMPNKSLDYFIFDSAKRELLNWETRLNIIEGIAQGLLYIHKYSRLLVIHRDLKASNILLDKDMNPKISDFGLARIFRQDTSVENTAKRVGTYGYMAPEYAMQGTFSVKSDIYSFGVILLEIVSGRKNNSFHDIEGPLSLVEFAWDQWKRCNAMNLIDPKLGRGSITTTDQMKMCIQVGLLCVQNHAIDRPTVEDVISMLKNETSSLPMPKEPAFMLRDDRVQMPRSGNVSLAEVSHSAMEGR